MLPFTHQQFLEVFASYNLAVFPAQIIAYLIGAGMITLLLRPGPNTDRMLSAGLALMWLWTGLVYHGLFFSPINPAAVAFGAAFALQGGCSSSSASSATTSTSPCQPRHSGGWAQRLSATRR